MNIDSLRVPQTLVCPSKLKVYEAMRRHEMELKCFLKGKLTSLKEDIIQGHAKSATQRILAI